MTVALILIISIVSVGFLLWMLERRWRRRNGQEEQPAEVPAEECCGMHITCENEVETEEFRDVLITMRPDDIAGWARSLQLRGIALPSPVRDELLMIVAEARDARLKPVADATVS